MQAFEYVAFISYRRENKTTARLLQNRIEAIGLPAESALKWVPQFSRCTADRPKQVKHFGSVLRDETHLGGSPSLTETIRLKLAGSCALVVLCSQDTPQPRADDERNWVDDEVVYYLEACRKQGRKPKVIPVLITHEIRDRIRVEDYYPPSLLNFAKALPGGPGDILWYLVSPDSWLASTNSFFAHTLDTGLLRAATSVVARVFEIGFDEIYDRELYRQRKIAVISAGVGTVIILLLASIGGYAIHQRNQAKIKEAYGLATLANQGVRDGAALMAFKWSKLALDPVADDKKELDRRWPAEVSLNRALQSLQIRGGLIYRSNQKPVGAYFSKQNEERLTVVYADGTIKLLAVPRGVKFTEIKEVETTNFTALAGDVGKTRVPTKLLFASPFGNGLALLEGSGALYRVYGKEVKALGYLPEPNKVMALGESSDGRLIALRRDSFDIVTVSAQGVQVSRHALPKGFLAASMAVFHRQPRLAIAGMCEKVCAGASGLEGAFMAIDLDGKVATPPVSVTPDDAFSVGVERNDAAVFVLDLSGHLAYRRTDSTWQKSKDDDDLKERDVYFAGEFSSDGRTILTASNQGLLREIDLETGATKVRAIDISESIYSIVSRSSAPEFAFIGSRTIASFDPTPVLPIRSVRQASPFVGLLPIASGVVAASEDGIIEWFDNSLAKRETLGSCSDTITDLVPLDDRRLAILTKEGKSCTLNVEMLSAIGIELVSTGTSSTVTKSADGKTTRVKLVGVTSKQELDCVAVNNLASVPAELGRAKVALVIPILGGDPLPVWMVGAGKTACVKLDPALNVRAVSKDGKSFISEEREANMRAVTAVIHTKIGHAMEAVPNPFGMSRYAFSADNTVLAALSPDDGHLQLADTRSGKPFAYFELASVTAKGSHGPFAQLAFSLDDNSIYVRRGDQLLSVPVPERYGPNYSLNGGPIDLLGDADFKRVYFYPEPLLDSVASKKYVKNR